MENRDSDALRDCDRGFARAAVAEMRERIVNYLVGQGARRFVARFIADKFIHDSEDQILDSLREWREARAQAESAITTTGERQAPATQGTE